MPIVRSMSRWQCCCCCSSDVSVMLEAAQLNREIFVCTLCAFALVLLILCVLYFRGEPNRLAWGKRLNHAEHAQVLPKHWCCNLSLEYVCSGNYSGLQVGERRYGFQNDGGGRLLWQSYSLLPG